MSATCATCRHWSNKVVRIGADEPARPTVCAAPAGIFAGEVVTARQSCDAHESDELSGMVREVAA